MKYNSALDGIRAIAILMVLGFHSLAPDSGGGFLGVDVFFVLSGFLITSLLNEELKRTGSIAFRRFYLRRLLRLTPPLIIMLGAYLVLAPIAWKSVSTATNMRDALLALFYLSDYSTAFWSIPEKLRHSWSLSVEEHFYLMWPVVCLLLTKLRSHSRSIIFLAMAYILTSAWRVYCDTNGSSGFDHSYYRFDTRLSGMVLGALAAHFSLIKRASSRHANLIGLSSILVLAYCTLHFTIRSDSGILIGIPGAELATLGLIFVGVSTKNSYASNILSYRPIVFLGRISYGVYLWHYPIFYYLWGRAPWFMTLMIGGLSSYLLALVSYYTIEKTARAYSQRLLHR